VRNVLLDTSIAIAAFRNDAPVLQQMADVQAVITAVVLGELYYGAHQASKAGEQMAYIALLVRDSILLACDQVTARRYALIKDDLRRRGLLIPENDIWIASSALQHGLPLATRDDHFKRIPGLIVEIW
jgi:tRNA(fMet)-specific endonuclease VapC